MKILLTVVLAASVAWGQDVSCSSDSNQSSCTNGRTTVTTQCYGTNCVGSVHTQTALEAAKETWQNRHGDLDKKCAKAFWKAHKGMSMKDRESPLVLSDLHSQCDR